MRKWRMTGILLALLAAGSVKGGMQGEIGPHIGTGYITVYAAENEKTHTDGFILSAWKQELQENLERASDIVQYIDTMTLHEKICQMIIADPENLVTTYNVREMNADMQQALLDYPVGGIMLKSRNIKSEKQLKKLLEDLQKTSKVPLFLAVDEEGGKVSRVLGTLGNREGTEIGPMYEYKDAGTDAAYENAKEIGENLSYYGFNLDFAPVADVWSNPDNTVIGTRAYSDDYKQAAELIPYAVEGFQAGGVMCTLKHFPGHGDTAEDSHYATAYVNATAEELKKTEFVPFQAGIQAGADCVMIGHLVVPAVSDQLADLSEEIVSGFLRDDLSFRGLVITDSFQMDAVTEYYTQEEAAVLAVKAGVDMILEPDDLDAVVTGLEQALENGEIDSLRIDKSLERILMAKETNEIILDDFFEKQ